MFAAVMSAKQSTGAVLMLLVLGDLIAIGWYRRSCEWRLLRLLLPSVLPGLVLGAAFIGLVDDLVLRRTIGAMLAVMAVLQVLRQRDPARAAPERPSRLVTATVGSAGGFATMVANAAGPVMALYLLYLRLPKQAFIGTTAWFFFVVNLTKLPFAAGLGLIDRASLTLNLVLAPAVILGAVIGIRTVRLLRQHLFERITLVLAFTSAASLLLLPAH